MKALGVAASRLLTGVASMVSQEGPTPQLAVLAEQVRTKAEGVEKVPLDQRSAVCKAFAAAGISVQARLPAPCFSLLLRHSFSSHTCQIVAPNCGNLSL